jgi:hypothetical protein
MDSFCVWIHPLGNACKVQVLGMKNAKWLLNRLAQAFVVKSSETVNEEECFPCCTFRVPYSLRTPRSTFEKLLAGIPEVRLMLDLA